MAIANDVTYASLLVFLAFQYAKAPEHDIAYRTGPPRRRLLLRGLPSAQVAVAAIPAPDAASATGLEAYRHELQRSREHSRDVWRMVAPLIPGCLVVALPSVIAPLLQKVSANPTIPINALPFCVLFAIWLTLIFPVRRRRLRRIQREIDIMDRLVCTSQTRPANVKGSGTRTRRRSQRPKKTAL